MAFVILSNETVPKQDEIQELLALFTGGMGRCIFTDSASRLESLSKNTKLIKLYTGEAPDRRKYIEAMNFNKRAVNSDVEIVFNIKSIIAGYYGCKTYVLKNITVVDSCGVKFKTAIPIYCKNPMILCGTNELIFDKKKTLEKAKEPQFDNNCKESQSDNNRSILLTSELIVQSDVLISLLKRNNLWFNSERKSYELHKEDEKYILSLHGTIPPMLDFITEYTLKHALFYTLKQSQSKFIKEIELLLTSLCKDREYQAFIVKLKREICEKECKLLSALIEELPKFNDRRDVFVIRLSKLIFKNSGTSFLKTGEYLDVTRVCELPRIKKFTLEALINREKQFIIQKEIEDKDIDKKC